LATTRRHCKCSLRGNKRFWIVKKQQIAKKKRNGLVLKAEVTLSTGKKIDGQTCGIESKTFYSRNELVVS
jgi:hypothetical protein